MKKLISDLERFQPFNEQERADQKTFLNILKHADDTIFTRENTHAHLTSSAWIINKDRNKVLMVDHLIYHSYSWVGGHCDGDHDTLHVALKEAQEETGLSDFNVLDKNLFSIEILDVKEHYKKGQFVEAHKHLNVTYLLEADDKDLLHIKVDENRGVKWIEVRNIINEVKETRMLEVYGKLILKSQKKLCNL